MKVEYPGLELTPVWDEGIADGGLVWYTPVPVGHSPFLWKSGQHLDMSSENWHPVPMSQELEERWGAFLERYWQHSQHSCGTALLSSCKLQLEMLLQSPHPHPDSRAASSCLEEVWLAETLGKLPIHSGPCSLAQQTGLEQQPPPRPMFHVPLTPTASCGQGNFRKCGENTDDATRGMAALAPTAQG